MCASFFDGALPPCRMPPDAAIWMMWLSIPAQHPDQGNNAAAPAVSLGFGNLTDGLDGTAAEDLMTIEPGAPNPTPDVTIDGPGVVLIGLQQGRIALAHPTAAGGTVQEDHRALRRILPPAQ